MLEKFGAAFCTKLENIRFSNFTLVENILQDTFLSSEQFQVKVSMKGREAIVYNQLQHTHLQLQEIINKSDGLFVCSIVDGTFVNQLILTEDLHTRKDCVRTGRKAFVQCVIAIACIHFPGFLDPMRWYDHDRNSTFFVLQVKTHFKGTHFNTVNVENTKAVKKDYGIEHHFMCHCNFLKERYFEEVS